MSIGESHISIIGNLAKPQFIKPQFEDHFREKTACAKNMEPPAPGAVICTIYLYSIFGGMNKTILTKWTSRDARTCPDPGTPE